MLPPPAPIVLISIVGTIIGRVPKTCWFNTFMLPSAMRDASKLVPPISIVIRLFTSIKSPNLLAPITPPAGPESIKCAGCSIAVFKVIAPPPDRVNRKLPVNCSLFKDRFKPCRYLRVIGLTYASITAVLVLSYSLYSRLSALDNVTSIFGHSSRITSAIFCSCSGYE